MDTHLVFLFPIGTNRIYSVVRMVKVVDRMRWGFPERNGDNQAQEPGRMRWPFHKRNGDNQAQEPG